MKTERLNLDQFKESVEKSGELEKISGGVLGSCHCNDGGNHTPSLSTPVYAIEIFGFKIYF